MDFHDRSREMGSLERAWEQTQPQLLTLWGRRRVGKTTLLTRFSRSREGIYFYGTRAGESDVLRALSVQAADWLQDDYLRQAPFSSWDQALTHLTARQGGRRWLLVLDEFPYLCEVTPGLDTLVQRWWDGLPDGAAPMVVLSGSGFTFMEGLVGARGPLHGRRTGQLEIRPFDFFDAARFFPHLDPCDRVRAYACFGGSPAYLRHIDADSLAANVQRTLLSPEHFLFREGEELLRTEFHQEALYSSILRAVAQGEHRPSDIARAVGRSAADQIFDHLRRLQSLDFLRREVPITEAHRSRTQRVLYKLSDPYLRFWFSFVAPFQSLLQLGKATALWEDEVAPSLDDFVSRTAWEEVCQQHLWRLVEADRLPARIGELGRWWDGESELDLVGLWRGQVTLVGECKWTAHPMGDEDLLYLRQRAGAKLSGTPLWVLASRSGFTPALKARAAAEGVLLIEPATLYDGL